MLRIIVNNQDVNLLQPISANIRSLEIINVPMRAKPVNKLQAFAIGQWMWDIAQRLDNDVLMYNGVLMAKNDVVKYKGK